MKRFLVVYALTLLAPLAVSAQEEKQTNGTDASLSFVPFSVEPVPFGPGEMMNYRARWGIFGTVGSGSLEVETVDTVRGEPSYKLAFRMKGKVIAFGMDDVQRSWLDVDELYSHRFHQLLNQTSYDRDRTLEFLTDEMRWVNEAKGEEGPLATDMPLDDVSFLYFVRTLPLEPGETYTLPRYYKDEGNPVTLKVLRREKIKVPAGEFETVVVRPIIKTKGMFSEGGDAEVWFTDDAERILVKLQAKMGAGPFGGTLKLELENFTPGTRLVSAPRSESLHGGK